MPPPNPRPHLEPTTGFLIVRVAEAVDRRFAARLGAVQLKPRQLHVLRYLKAAGAISHTELAGGIEVDAANLIDTLDQLEAAGLVRREIDAHDRRRRRIRLTPAGTRKLRAGLRAAERADHDVLGTLDPHQLRTVHEAMLHAYHNTHPDPGSRTRHNPAE